MPGQGVSVSEGMHLHSTDYRDLGRWQHEAGLDERPGDVKSEGKVF